MDSGGRDAAKPLLTIKHLIASSIENERRKEPFLRGRPFKWQKSLRKITDRKEKRHVSMPLMESEQREEESADEFSDARSNTEACSLSMLSDLNTADDDEDDGSEDAEEENRRNFIMDRFLPAATAMASESAHDQQSPASKRPTSPQHGRRVPLLRQSRPYLTRKCSVGGSDDDEDERVSFKIACGGLFSLRLKKNGFVSPRMNPLSFLSPRRKANNNRQCVYKDEDETSSGTDEERAVIMATRRKAWEARYRQQQLWTCSSLTPSREFSSSPEIGQALLNRISYNANPHSYSKSQSRSPLRRTSPSLRSISPYRNEARVSPFNQEGKGFLGIPRDWRAENSKTVNEKDSFQNGNENEQEEYYSGHSSPLHSDSSAAAVASSSKTCYLDSDRVNVGANTTDEFNNKIEGSTSTSSPVSVLPPPLPKSPSESWLWRAIPQLNNNNYYYLTSQFQGVGKAMKADREDFDTSFDDAKWEI